MPIILNGQKYRPRVGDDRVLTAELGGAKFYSVLDGAVAAWRASDYEGGTHLTDRSGRGHHARFGSTAGADSNDPLWLPWAGETHLYLPGIAGNFASAPDAAALRVTGDIDLRGEAQLANWTNAVQVIVGKDDGSANRSYYLRVEAGGILRFVWNDGSTMQNILSTAGVGFANDARRWVRATLDVDTGSGWAVRFYTSEDGQAWTQLGSTVTGGTATTIATTAAPVVTGALGNGTFGMVLGKLYRAQIFASIDGTDKRLDIDFTALGSYNAARTELTGQTGQTLTINRSASGRKAVVAERPRLLAGTDDFLGVPDHADLDFAAAESFTLARRYRAYGTPSANQVLAAKKANLTTGAGYALYIDTSRRAVGIVADGAASTTVTSGVLTAGLEHTVALVRDVDADQIRLVVNGAVDGSATDATTGTIANSEELRFSRLSGAGTNYADEEWVGAALFRRALSAGEAGAVGGDLL